MKELKDKKTNWKTTDNRFVAFFDILGFKDMVMRKSHNEIYELLTNISKTRKLLTTISNNKTVIEECGEDTEIYIVNFSDSIVLFSKNDQLGNFKYFLVAIRWLFAKAIENKIPLKGGFAHGEISVNKSEQVYFGQPIIDAYLIEEDVNYFGAVAHNSIDKFLSDNKNEKKLKYAEKFLIEGKTPLKSGNIEHINLNWFSVAHPDELKTAEEISNHLFTLVKDFKSTVSGSPRRYIDNSIDFIDRIKKQLKQ